jgi:hypothetical protein
MRHLVEPSAYRLGGTSGLWICRSIVPPDQYQKRYNTAATASMSPNARWRYRGSHRVAAMLMRRSPLSEIRPVPRRGLSRVEAAMYLGISPSKFDELRKAGRIGPAKILDSRKLYAIELIDEFFDALPDESRDSVEDWTVAL